MRDFFTAPTVAGLAALMEGVSGAGDTIVHVPDSPSHPASHAQARLYLATHMAEGAEGAGAAYNITFALPFGGPLDPLPLLFEYPEMLGELAVTVQVKVAPGTCDKFWMLVIC